jgi:hypothetical protein
MFFGTKVHDVCRKHGGKEWPQKREQLRKTPYRLRNFCDDVRVQPRLYGLDQ